MSSNHISTVISIHHPCLLSICTVFSKKKTGVHTTSIFKTDYPRFLKSYRCIHYSIKDLGWRVRLQQETGYHQQLAINLLTRRHPLIDHKVKQESIPVGCIPPPANLTVVHVSVATRCQHQYGRGSTSRNGVPVQWESMSGARKGSSTVRTHVPGSQGKGSLYCEIQCLWAGLGPRPPAGGPCIVRSMHHG